MLLPAGALLSALLAAPQTCLPNDQSSQRVQRERVHLQLDKHHPQGRALTATLLPAREQPWLEGERLRGRLEGGRLVEITTFAGETVHARRFEATTAHWTSLRLHPSELVGLRWSESRCRENACTRRWFRIAAVARDHSQNTMPAHGSNRDVWLYRVESASSPNPKTWQPVCTRTPGDTDMGIFVPGRWAHDGSWHAGGYTFSCARGVIAKCARTWGYKPWRTLALPEQGSVALRPLHLACVRAARADYCGDGVSHTRDGVRIGLSDRYSLNPTAPPGARIESRFDEAGAVHVFRARVLALAPSCDQIAAPTAVGPPRPSRQTLPALLEVWNLP
ncbi:ADYC domain-containing protein [Haliangium sp.]